MMIEPTTDTQSQPAVIPTRPARIPFNVNENEGLPYLIQVRNMVASGVYKVGPGAWWCDQERFYEEIGGRQYVVDWARIDRIQRADGIAIVWIGEAFTVLVPCRDDRGRAFVAVAEGHVAR